MVFFCYLDQTPRSGLTKNVGPDLDPKCLTICVILKYVFLRKKSNFKENKAETYNRKNHIFVTKVSL